MQLNHYNTKFTKREFPITIVCDNITNAPNIGSLFRIADAFGVKELIFCGEHIPLGRKMTKTSRATEKVVSHQINVSAIEVVKILKAKNYGIISLEITANSKAIHEFSVSKKNLSY